MTAIRPPWPWSEEAPRIKDDAARHLVLTNDHEDLVAQFVCQTRGLQTEDVRGQLDMALNPLVSFATQLSNPGLYGDPPTLSHPDPAAQPLIKTGGYLELGGHAATLHEAEYHARGTGAVAVVPYITRNPVAPLRFHLAFKHDLHVEVFPDDPMTPARLFWLRMHRGEYCFEVWDLTGPEPRFYYGDPNNPNKPLADPPSPALVGDTYPWRYADSSPYIPHVFYRTTATAFWGDGWRLRPLHRATFFAIDANLDFRHANKAAAFGRMVAIDLELATDTQGRDTGVPFRTLTITPGAILSMRTVTDSNINGSGTVMQFPPSADPSLMLRANIEYQQMALQNCGLRAPDTTRTNGGGNPTSAAALVLGDADRRQGQRSLAPMVRAADLELLNKSAALVNRARPNDPPLPEEGYSIGYHLLPLSPEERAADQATAKDEHALGLISTVDLYQRFHPGTDADAARQQILRAQREEAQLRLLRPRPQPPTPQPAPPNHNPPTDPEEGEE